MASGNSSNANRYKGEDIDTDGDGSVNDAQTLQNNQPSDLGNSIDKETIREDLNGDLRGIGLFFPSENSDVVQIYQSTSGSYGSSVSLNSGEIAVIYEASISSDQFESNDDDIGTVIADGVTLTMRRGFTSSSANNRILKLNRAVIVRNSFSINHKSGGFGHIGLTYRVIKK